MKAIGSMKTFLNKSTEIIVEDGVSHVKTAVELLARSCGRAAIFIYDYLHDLRGNNE